MSTKIILQLYILTTGFLFILAKDLTDYWDNLEIVSCKKASRYSQLTSPSDQEIYRETLLNTKETCEKFEYLVEEHNIATADGYFLTLFRIPKGKKGKSKDYPLLLQHGIMTSSQFYVDNRENSLAFYLADNGYDVWLGNFRGTVYTSHRTYTRAQTKFWNFSWDELADYDITAMIDYILRMTSKPKLVYIGHSIGTTAMFSLLESQKIYHDKVAGFIALCPITGLSYTTSMFRHLVPKMEKFGPRSNLIGINHILSVPTELFKLIQHYCPADDTIVCGTLLDLAAGYDPYLRNNTRNFISLLHLLKEGESVPIFAHYAQLYRKKEFLRYDYGRLKNLVKYSSISPPAYDLKKIKLPIAIIYGANDVWSNAIDVTLALRKLSNVIDVKLIDFPMFNHADIAFAINAKELFYKDILLYLEKMTK